MPSNEIETRVCLPVEGIYQEATICYKIVLSILISLFAVYLLRRYEQAILSSVGALHFHLIQRYHFSFSSFSEEKKKKYPKQLRR